MATGTKKYILWRFCLCSLLIGTLSILTLGVNANAEEIPSELQCRPYIEKALKDLEAGDVHSESRGDIPDTGEQSDVSQEDTSPALENESTESIEENAVQEDSPAESQESNSLEMADEPYVEEMIIETDNAAPTDDSSESNSQEEAEQADKSSEDSNSNESMQNDEAVEASAEKGDSQETSAEETTPEDENGTTSSEVEAADDSQSEEATEAPEVEDAQEATDDADSKENASASDEADSKEDDTNSSEESEPEGAAENQSAESAESAEEQTADAPADASESTEADSKEEEQSETAEEDAAPSDEVNSAETEDAAASTDEESAENKEESAEGEESAEKKDESEESKEEAEMQKDDADASAEQAASEESQEAEAVEENVAEEAASEADASQSAEQEEEATEATEASEGESEEAGSEAEAEAASEAEAEAASEEPETPEDDLLMELVIPDNLRSKDHIGQLLRLDSESTEAELLIEKSADVMLRELKRLYDSAIKPLEILYKYRDLSNRHYGDPEIFSKPLVLFMGPWSGGKSSLINYLTDNEFTEWSLRTGAEPSPAYFNILMHGKEPEVLDGTQLAADWTFSGLQKFGQGLEERLRGLKLPNKLLERVNIVEIPGILEVRKQVSRVFPFNDACQWFIDRADIIFLVYDPSKLDVGPETEAILDQLKGREANTRIILNKADQVKPEELMRVQSALIWNISPLMSSAQPPIMYTTSLWSMPYEVGSPARLLQSQEKAFLRDLRGAIDKRIENKISSARRFAVRVRNHAKMVDCYLTTYYNHKTIFGNKKVVAEAIIEHPQNYHIYEGLSTLTNISRYDLPDPETYRDFFRLNPLFEFQQLSATCTYFRGCPINRLDVAIAYDLPELVGKYKKMVETVTPQGMPKS